MKVGEYDFNGRRSFVPAVPVAIRGGPDILPEDGPPSLWQLGEGDTWPLNLEDSKMSAQVEVNQDRLEVTLAFRLDGISDDVWSSLDEFPAPLALFVVQPLACFLLDMSGIRFAALYPIGLGTFRTSRIRTALTDPTISKVLRVFGVNRNIIRIRKSGLLLDLIWSDFAACIATAPDEVEPEEFLSAAKAAHGRRPVDLIYSEAMRRYMKPRPAILRSKGAVRLR